MCIRDRVSTQSTGKSENCVMEISATKQDPGAAPAHDPTKLVVHRHRQEEAGSEEPPPVYVGQEENKTQTAKPKPKVRIVRSRRHLAKRTTVQATKENLWKGVDPEALGEHAVVAWREYDADRNGLLDREEVVCMGTLTASPAMTLVDFATRFTDHDTAARGCVCSE
eukprot:TRINITY_DN5145_c0_g1_i5.p1 TRINITY_DN5145_c0_g1~~TRINITY_DN5145_c0_g1_i5.p1  ORF type:complete len:167 (-),score=37.92 TRINITY_DN5145_c0_g1_i5:469-969(-)